MGWLRRLIDALLGLGGLTAPDPPLPPGPPAPPGEPALALLAAHNAARVRFGRLPLALDPRLCVSAADQAVRCASLGILGHIGPGLDGPGARMRRAGYRWAACGENAAEGQPDAAAAVAAWLADPAHRSNILGGWTHMGGAVAVDRRGIHWWVCDYASPAS